jgi:hypothetical protein
MDPADPAYGGQSDYSPLLLRLYHPLVLGPIARFVWRCPTPRLVAGYQQHIRAAHLDVGPGTGFLVERAGLPRGSPVTLADPNPNVLRHCLPGTRARKGAAVELRTRGRSGRRLNRDLCRAWSASPVTSHALRGTSMT